MIRPTMRMWKRRSTSLKTASSYAYRFFRELFYVVLNLLTAVFKFVLTINFVVLNLFTAVFKFVFTANFVIFLIIVFVIAAPTTLIILNKRLDAKTEELFKPTVVSKAPERNAKHTQIPELRPLPPNKKFDDVVEPSDIDYVLTGLGYEDNKRFRTCVLEGIQVDLKSGVLLTMQHLNAVRDKCVVIESEHKAKDAVEKQNATIQDYLKQKKGSL